ncbi:PAS domain-containing sensor histidine kinase [Hyalangium versicolor]|uniref:PAS domain-containing sensor histidine kinase n=1 Tax=Hyalangium versicolor TaxID=2861190 RepID=UPI001CC9A8E0|nr:ATP-binding protein [Hyalangium versicolor]
MTSALEQALQAQVEELKQEIASLKERAAASQRVESELRQSRKMLQLMMDNIPQVVFWKDRHSTYVGCNQNFATIAGLERPEQIVGKVDQELPWTQEEADWYRKCDAQVMGDDEAWLQITESQTTANGKQIWINTNKVPLHDEHGQVVGILGTAEDITSHVLLQKELREKNAALESQTDALAKVQRELMKSNEELEERVRARTQKIEDQNQQLSSALAELSNAQEQLIHAEKMASLGMLTAGVAHELKNPLNFVLNFSELAIEFLSDLDEAMAASVGQIPPPVGEVVGSLRENMVRIREHGARANDIIQTMLLHSRRAPGERRPTPLNPLLTECVQFAYQGFRTKDQAFNLAIHTDLDPAVGEVSLVKQSISRAYLNIINNACYSVREAQKQLRGSRPPELWISSRLRGDAVEIRVRDNGLGISPEKLKRIFDPFFTTKPPGDGIGLGLSLCYDIIVKEHGGSMQMESQEGAYAEMITTLPCKPVEKSP